MPGRGIVSSTGYRYGFNGKEDDKETVGSGNGTQDYGLRIYNPSLGKFLSVDPLTSDFPWYTPYQFAGNMPIKFIDLDGAEPCNPDACPINGKPFKLKTNDKMTRNRNFLLVGNSSPPFGSTNGPTSVFPIYGRGTSVGTVNTQISHESGPEFLKTLSEPNLSVEAGRRFTNTMGIELFGIKSKENIFTFTGSDGKQKQAKEKAPFTVGPGFFVDGQKLNSMSSGNVDLRFSSTTVPFAFVADKSTV